jgi:hydrogenase maturation protease
MMSSSVAKVLVLGLGNDILTDDAVGLEVAREVDRRLGKDEAIEVRWTIEMGLSLLDEISGYAALVLVDAVQTGRAPPGHVHELVVSDLQIPPSVTPHFLGVGETLALGRMLGLPMPEHVRIIGIEVEDMRTLGTELTVNLAAALPGVIDIVLAAARAECQRLKLRTQFVDVALGSAIPQPVG